MLMAIDALPLGKIVLSLIVSGKSSKSCLRRTSLDHVFSRVVPYRVVSCLVVVSTAVGGSVVDPSLFAALYVFFVCVECDRMKDVPEMSFHGVTVS